MSEVVPHKKSIYRAGKFREYRAPAEQLDFGEGALPVKVRLADKTNGRGTCLGCHDAPCMMLSAGDTALPEALSDFPGDPNRGVCPTHAISWNDESEAVFINAACIGCGLCAARCPYGAISLTAEGKAVVEISDPDKLTAVRANEPDPAEHANPQRVGQLGKVRSPALHQMPESIGMLNDIESSQFVRNLLIECGISCRIRRRGDTNIRMDGVLGLSNDRLGVLEIELSIAVLESPRALLEDVAVLHSRYGIEVERIDPVSVILGLPNARSEYFQVIADIEKVLGIRCRTLTIGCLLAVLWRFQTIDGFTENLFMTSPVDTDLLPAMKRFISELIPPQPYSGAYRPSK
jgi:ferredoxin